MSSQDKEYRVEVRVRNNLILKKMEERGIKSVAELCRVIGKPSQQSHVGDIINLKLSPVNQQTGKWREVVVLMANALGCFPEELFSDEQLNLQLEKNRSHFELHAGEIQKALGITSAEERSPETQLEFLDVHRTISLALNSLTPREERVIRLRFGLGGVAEHTLAEIALELGVTHEYVRHIELNALHKLRHPSRLVQLSQVTCVRSGPNRFDVELDGDLFNKS